MVLLARAALRTPNMTAHRTRQPTQIPAPSDPFAAGQSFLTTPFDAMRFHYASAVMAGLVPRSILAAGRLEQTLATLEALILGPLARQR